jgi:hypothetical protein
MPPRKKAARILLLEVVRPELRSEALLQTDGALDHNASDESEDDTLTHRISQTTNPCSTKTLAGIAAIAEANMRGFEGPSTQDIGQPIIFTAP